MNALQNLVQVKFELCEGIPLPLSGGGNNRKPSSFAPVIPGMLLTTKATLSVPVTSGETEAQLRQSFLAQVGEHDFEKVCRILFHQIGVTPFLMDGQHLEEDIFIMTDPHSRTADQPCYATTKFTPGIPYFWEETWNESAISLHASRVVADETSSHSGSSSKCAILQRTEVLCCQSASSSLSCLQFEYRFSFQVPPLFVFHSPTLAFVLHLLLDAEQDLSQPRDLTRESIPVVLQVLSDQGYSATDSESIIRTSGVQPMIVFGSGYIPIVICAPLTCRCTSRAVKADHVSLSLVVVNTFPIPVRLLNAFFDTQTTRIVSADDKNIGIPPSYTVANQRVGHSWKDHQTVQLLTQILTATSVMAQGEIFVLQPGESFSFQFSLQLLPAVSYWLFSSGTEKVKLLNSSLNVSLDDVKQALALVYATHIFLKYDVDARGSYHTDCNSHSITQIETAKWSFRNEP